MAFLTGHNMLFHISTSLGLSIANGDQESIDCMMRLLDSRKSGLLLIYSSKKTISIIIDYFRKNGQNHQADLLSSISRKFREKRQLIKDLTNFVIISCHAPKKPILKNRIIYARPESINRSNMLYPPILLGENLTDCDLYGNIISKNFNDGIPTSLKQIHISDRFEPGGGNSTHTSYRRHKEKGIDFCFCIVDSDRKCPQEGLGETANLVVKIDNKEKSPLCSYLVIDMYSAENLLPFEEIERQYCIGKDQNQINIFSKIKKIRAMPSWKHLPLKKGIRGKDLKTTNAGSKYWHEEMKKIGEELPCCEILECECDIMPKINEKTLANALRLENTPWKSLLNSEKNPQIRADYLEISKTVRSWLCVGAAIRL